MSFTVGRLTWSSVKDIVSSKQMIDHFGLSLKEMNDFITHFLIARKGGK